MDQFFCLSEKGRTAFLREGIERKRNQLVSGGLRRGGNGFLDPIHGSGLI